MATSGQNLTKVIKNAIKNQYCIFVAFLIIFWGLLVTFFTLKNLLFGEMGNANVTSDRHFRKQCDYLVTLN